MMMEKWKKTTPVVQREKLAAARGTWGFFLSPYNTEKIGMSN